VLLNPVWTVVRIALFDINVTIQCTQAISDLASGSDAMKHKTRHALEKELLSTRSALRRALEEVKARENQVGALEMMSRQLQDELMEFHKSKDGAQTWGISNLFTNPSPLTSRTQAAAGLAEFADTARKSISNFGGSVTERQGRTRRSQERTQVTPSQRTSPQAFSGESRSFASSSTMKETTAMKPRHASKVGSNEPPDSAGVMFTRNPSRSSLPRDDDLVSTSMSAKSDPKSPSYFSTRSTTPGSKSRGTGIAKNAL
jgi:hypothetical protein